MPIPSYKNTRYGKNLLNVILLHRNYRLSMILVIIVIFTSWLAAPAPKAQATLGGYLQNFGFESGSLSPWEPYTTSGGHGTVQVANFNARTGSWSALIQTS